MTAEGLGMTKRASLLLLFIALSVQVLSATGLEKAGPYVTQSGLCSDKNISWTLSVSDTEAFLEFRENGQILPSASNYIIKVKDESGNSYRFSASSGDGLIYVDDKELAAFKHVLNTSSAVDMSVVSAGRKPSEEYVATTITCDNFLDLYAELFARPVNISVTDQTWRTLVLPVKSKKLSLDRKLFAVLTDSAGYVYEGVYGFDGNEIRTSLELQSISDDYTITVDYVVSGSLMAHFVLQNPSKTIFISEESLVPEYKRTLTNWKYGKSVDNGKILTKTQRMLLGRNSIGLSAGYDFNAENGLFRLGLTNENNIRLPNGWRIGLREDAALLADDLKLQPWYEISAALTFGHLFKINDYFSFAADIGAGGGYMEWDNSTGYLIRVPVSASLIIRNGLQLSLECFTDLIFYTKTTEKTTSSALSWNYSEDKMAITVTPALVLRYTYR